jgi:hypothetical protein
MSDRLFRGQCLQGKLWERVSLELILAKPLRLESCRLTLLKRVAVGVSLGCDQHRRAEQAQGRTQSQLHGGWFFCRGQM